MFEEVKRQKQGDEEEKLKGKNETSKQQKKSC